MAAAPDMATATVPVTANTAGPAAAIVAKAAAMEAVSAKAAIIAAGDEGVAAIETGVIVGPVVAVVITATVIAVIIGATAASIVSVIGDAAAQQGKRRQRADSQSRTFHVGLLSVG
jgi:hypothetical protein